MSSELRASVDLKFTEFFMYLKPKSNKALIQHLISSLRSHLQSCSGQIGDDTKALQDFWLSAPEPFGMFVVLARAVFSAQATSVPSEVAFSSSGFIKSKFRSKLDPNLLSVMRELRSIHPKEMVSEFIDRFLAYVQSEDLADDLRAVEGADESDESNDSF
jgi:hypothetical protein